MLRGILVLRFLVFADADLLNLLRHRGHLGALGLKLLNFTGGVDQLLLAGVERVAVRADFNGNFAQGGTEGKDLPATAGGLGLIKILRVDAFFHIRIGIV